MCMVPSPVINHADLGGFNPKCVNNSKLDHERMDTWTAAPLASAMNETE